MKKSILSVILCAVMVLALLSGCALSKINTSYDTSSLSGSLAEKSSSGYSVSALVLYCFRDAGTCGKGDGRVCSDCDGDREIFSLRECLLHEFVGVTTF
ncbi:MAG: hypothetical protein PHY23_03770, partial [Oscillospiraceae bacterium]|nr:hypothetical protein [Oscillospiraceae bacterium]